MPDILKRFSAYKNTLTQHGAIAVIGLGMVALGVDASYFFDVPFLQTVSKTAGGVAWLATLLDYMKRWDSFKNTAWLEDDTEVEPTVKTMEERACITRSIPQGLASAATCVCAGFIVNTLCPVIHNNFTEILPRNHAIESNKQLDDLCLAPATSREVLLGGKPTTIIIDERVTEHKVLPDNTMTHSATVHFQYPLTSIFAKNGHEMKDLGTVTITREGPFDPKAVAEGRGCTPLKDFNFDN